MSLWYLVIIWAIVAGGAGTSALVWTPETPIGVMTLIFLGLVFLGHVALMLANRVREAIVVPGVQAVFVVAMYLMMTSLSTLMPEVVEQSALWQWFLGLS